MTYFLQRINPVDLLPSVCKNFRKPWEVFSAGKAGFSTLLEMPTEMVNFAPKYPAYGL